jgi:choline monooxygenase
VSALDSIIAAYDAAAPLSHAATIPSAWYTHPEIAALERDTVFSRSWQYIGRADQLAAPGCFVTGDIAGEPVLAVRGRDDVLRAFYNVCRHHAAAIATAPCGQAAALKCPYHGWTYGLDGQLKGVPEFDGVCDFDRAASGLVPVRLETWEGLVFVCLDPAAPGLRDHLGDMGPGVDRLEIGGVRFRERRGYDLACNWKVYVDNYLDGGYHVPHIHKDLGSVLDYSQYRVETGGSFCLQSSPIASGGDAQTAAVRRGNMAYYYWLYPNFMLNWYEGVMDINLVLPLGVDRCRVIFDFFFAAADTDADRQAQSITVAERVQQEDIDICESVQRGLISRAYDVGRLSVRREGGEHLFHRLLHADLTRRS